VIDEIFSIQDYDAVVGTATGNPPLELYFEALQNVGGAIFLQCMFLCTGFLCLVSIHTWQSRMVLSPLDKNNSRCGPLHETKRFRFPRRGPKSILDLVFPSTRISLVTALSFSLAHYTLLPPRVCPL